MRTYAQQKAALTRAVKRGYDDVLEECERVVAEWEKTAWPDDWSRWQRALDDAHMYDWHEPGPRLEDLT